MDEMRNRQRTRTGVLAHRRASWRPASRSRRTGSRPEPTPTPAPTATPVPTPAGPTPTPSFVRPTPTPQPTFFSTRSSPATAWRRSPSGSGRRRGASPTGTGPTYPSLDPESGSVPAGLPEASAGCSSSSRTPWSTRRTCRPLPPGPTLDPAERRPDDWPVGRYRVAMSTTTRRRSPDRRDRRGRRPPGRSGQSRRARTPCTRRRDPPRRRGDRPRRDVRRGDAGRRVRRRWTACCISGGADLHPERYGQTEPRLDTIELDRDALEHEAWAVAQARGRPGPRGLPRLPGDQRVLGRHAPPARRRPPGTALGQRPGQDPSAPHRARARDSPGSSSRPTPAAASCASTPITTRRSGRRDLAPGLVANAWASSPAGDLIEGLEAADGRFVFGVQCHPERTESTPAAFERLFSVFVDAARGPADRR